MEYPTKLSAWRHPRAAGKGQTGVEGLVHGRFITRMSHGGSLGDSVGKGLTGSKVYLVNCTACNSKDQLSEAMADDLFKAVGPEYISYACRQAALLPVQQVLHIWRGQPSKEHMVGLKGGDMEDSQERAGCERHDQHTQSAGC